MARFCTAVERLDWAADLRFTTNAQRVQQRNAGPLIEMVMRTRTCADWQQRFLDTGWRMPGLNYPQPRSRRWLSAAWSRWRQEWHRRSAGSPFISMAAGSTDNAAVWESIPRRARGMNAERI